MHKIKTFPSKIKGTVKISGSKNASLPIIVAALLNEGQTFLTNVPEITDIKNLLNVLKKLEAIKYQKGNLVVIKGNIKYQDLLFYELQEFRASYYFMGLFLTLFNEVNIYVPGGCKIGKRPINFHIEGFKKAGVEVIEDSNIIHLKTKELKPFFYELPKKSLGATVNLLLLASKINGKSVIKNASTEPEIDDLIEFLNKMNIKTFRFQNMIIINGVKKIRKYLKHKIMPDRIEAITFAVMGVYSQSLLIKNIKLQHLLKPLEILEKAGAKITKHKSSIKIQNSQLNPVVIESGDYPQLSTDQMPLLYPLFIRVKGASIFEEKIFDGRFKALEELLKTNANIKIENHKVIIMGEENLVGGNFIATDLRGAAALLIEAVINGDSTVENLHYLERGYENIYEKLKRIGINFNIM